MKNIHMGCKALCFVISLDKKLAWKSRKDFFFLFDFKFKSKTVRAINSFQSLIVFHCTWILVHMSHLLFLNVIQNMGVQKLNWLVQIHENISETESATANRYSLCKKKKKKNFSRIVSTMCWWTKYLVTHKNCILLAYRMQSNFLKLNLTQLYNRFVR